MKSLGVCNWYVKLPQCGCVVHALEYIMIYVQKQVAPLVVFFWLPAGSRQATVGAHIWETPSFKCYVITFHM